MRAARATWAAARAAVSCCLRSARAGCALCPCRPAAAWPLCRSRARRWTQRRPTSRWLSPPRRRLGRPPALRRSHSPQQPPAAAAAPAPRRSAHVALPPRVSTATEAAVRGARSCHTSLALRTGSRSGTPRHHRQVVCLPRRRQPTPPRAAAACSGGSSGVPRRVAVGPAHGGRWGLRHRHRLLAGWLGGSAASVRCC